MKHDKTRERIVRAIDDAVRLPVDQLIAAADSVIATLPSAELQELSIGDRIIWYGSVRRVVENAPVGLRNQRRVVLDGGRIIEGHERLSVPLAEEGTR